MVEKTILERLEALIQLSIPPLQAIEKETDEIRVLRLCDYSHTREEISRSLKKSLNRVDVVLNALRKTGKIRSVSKDGSTVYIRMRT